MSLTPPRDRPAAATSRAYPVPVGNTARRVEWAHLPPTVRAAVEERCGSGVVHAISQGGGFTPGFASVLECADGSRHFVKAASLKAQAAFAQSYAEEARKLGALPAAVAAPQLLWTAEIAGWRVLETEYVDARAPRRPWRLAELDQVLDLLEETATLLTPAPAGLDLDDVATEFAAWPATWERVTASPPDLPGADHLATAAALAARFVEVTGGDTLVHTDVRDDNLLIGPDGSVLLCDWNWPVRGAAWLDSLLVLIGPRGDGLDVDAVLRRRALTRDVDPEAVDIVLALLTGYFLATAREPVPPTSPHIRAHQRWQGEVCWAWLCERRGW